MYKEAKKAEIKHQISKSEGETESSTVHSSKTQGERQKGNIKRAWQDFYSLCRTYKFAQANTPAATTRKTEYLPPPPRKKNS